MGREAQARVVTPIVAKDHTFELVDLGLLFRNFHKFDIDDEGTAEILFKTGDPYAHVRLNAEADGDTHIQIYAGTITTDDGVLEPSGNFNFNSSTTAVMEMYTAPAISNDGLYIANTWILGGSGLGVPATAKAAASMSDLDVVLTPNTNFMIRFTNYADRAIQVLFEIDFLEREHDRSS